MSAPLDPKLFAGYQAELAKLRKLDPRTRRKYRDLEFMHQEKAAESLLHFMEYTWQRPLSPLIVGRHTIEICNVLDQAIEDFRNGISTYISMAVPYRHGKALEINTEIPVWDQCCDQIQYRKIKDVHVGDYVFAPDGTPTLVTGETPIQKDRPVYEVKTSDGISIIADAEHEWSTRLDEKHRVYRPHTTEMLYNRQQRRSKGGFTRPAPGIKRHEAVDFECSRDDLPIEPWLLGFWLGDGTSANSGLTVSPQDVDFVADKIRRYGYDVRPAANAESLRLGVRRSKQKPDGLLIPLRAEGLLKNKHIPEKYLNHGSAAVRLELLQGLIDSDGYVPETGQIEFCSITENLGNGVLQLVRSLGFKAAMYEGEAKLYGKYCSQKYRVCFYMPDAAQTPRRKRLCRMPRRTDRYLTFVPAGTADVKCIEVEHSSHEYLCTRGFVRTHNSDCSSRYLPAKFVGEFPDEPVITGSYAASLSEGFSRDTKKIMDSPQYQKVYDTRLDPKTDNAKVRGIKDNTGKLIYVGADGGATGNGAALLVIDDFFKNRKEAESETIRDSRWESFQSDFFTRLGPVHIVIVLNTRWHVDDISGRIINRNDPDHEDYDPEFPKFRQLVFPAMDEDGSYLFPERFSDHWYRVQFAVQGGVNSYGANCMLQGEPRIRGGNMIKTGLVHFNAEMPDDILYSRAWDLASTEEERDSEDPDYTFGVCVGVKVRRVRDLLGKHLKDDEGKPVLIVQLFIEHGSFCKEEATKRDQLIRSAALEDGPEVWQGVESVAGYKDKFTTMRDILKGIRIVRKILLKGDKVTRAAKLEPIFDAGNVFVSGHPSTDKWVALLMKHIEEFPKGKHDDGVDALVNAFELAMTRWQESGALQADDIARVAVS